ncbi:phosphatase PAP2 family protein [Candidatus Acetothermia bacterium]|nr:phosphatase PAP2 family protein [Candidatus Acetothermia bacterium]
MITRIIAQLDEWTHLIGKRIHQWDFALLEAISDNPTLRRFPFMWIILTFLGDGYIWAIISAALLLFGRPIDQIYVSIGLSITAVNIVIFRSLKLLFKRARPVYVPISSRALSIDQFSFPSGHTCAAFGLAFIFAFFYPLFIVQVTVYTVAILIGLSRIYVKEHYPSDVIFGALLGPAISVLFLPVSMRVFM